MNFSIQSLFEKFKHLKNPKEEKEKIAGIVSFVVGIEITGDKVSVTKNILALNIDSYIKTEIFMKKGKILEALNQSKFFIKDIR